MKDYIIIENKNGSFKDSINGAAYLAVFDEKAKVEYMGVFEIGEPNSWYSDHPLAQAITKLENGADPVKDNWHVFSENPQAEYDSMISAEKGHYEKVADSLGILADKRNSPAVKAAYGDPHPLDRLSQNQPKPAPPKSRPLDLKGMLETCKKEATASISQTSHGHEQKFDMEVER